MDTYGPLKFSLIQRLEVTGSLAMEDQTLQVWLARGDQVWLARRIRHSRFGWPGGIRGGESDTQGLAGQEDQTLQVPRPWETRHYWTLIQQSSRHDWTLASIQQSSTANTTGLRTPMRLKVWWYGHPVWLAMGD